MTKGFKKKQSKRMSCRTRYKIAKKVRDHSKKLKKLAKKNPKNKKTEKDIGIPNSLPFKEDILIEAEQHRQKTEQEKEKLKLKRQKERENIRNNKRIGLSDIASNAEKRQKEFESREKIISNMQLSTSFIIKNEQSLKQFSKELLKVIEASDVVLEVLDARDPLATRSSIVEEAVLSSGRKKLVLILNKIDLIPKQNVVNWLAYLRKKFPTIAFKASTQNQKTKLGHSKGIGSVTHSTCIGANTLMKLLGNYCRKHNIKTAISVGIVGVPNTGKSSIINSLKRQKACATGGTPGITKSLQEVVIDKHIKLIDSPGVVVKKNENNILQNCIKITSLVDPISIVDEILLRCPKQHLQILYKLPNFSDTNDFLVQLALKQGKLKKGGLPNLLAAGKVVLNDWNQGRIHYYTEPPEIIEKDDFHVNSEIVQSMSNEFDIDALLNDERDELAAMDTISVCGHVKIDSLINYESSNECVEEAMDADIESNIKIDIDGFLKSQRKPEEGRLKFEAMQLNKERKKNFKRLIKQRKKSDNVAKLLSEEMDDALDDSNDMDDDDID